MPDSALRYEVNCSILFTELPLLRRPAAAAAAGFDAVEFWWPFSSSAPTTGELEDFADAVQQAGVTLAGLNFSAGDMAGDRGLVSWPGRENEFADNVEATIQLGTRLGCRAFNALYGNRLDGLDPQQQDEVAMQNLATAAAAAHQVGGVVLVEPLSGADRYPLRTVADVVALAVRAAATPGLRFDGVMGYESQLSLIHI